MAGLHRCGRWIALAAAYAGCALGVYRNALTGALVSDDVGYLLSSWVRTPDLAGFVAILDPNGVPAHDTGNYAPVHLLGHVLALRVFGDALVAHHALNVVLHALCSTALVALWVRFGIGFAGAVFLGAVFLLHPANVEAVAWITQLKSLLGLSLACVALLLEPRRPALAAAAFAAALLAKFQAVFALPVAILALALEPPARGAHRRRAAWLGVWVLVLAAVALPQLTAFQGVGGSNQTIPEAGLARILFTLALVGRYAVMAATSWGVSAFHQPDAPTGLGDGWVLLGTGVIVLAAIRFVAVLRRRDAEAVFWVWAAAALFPVAQFLPFVYPMADRYLYFVLPGLLGALGLALRAPLARWSADPQRRLAVAAPALALLAAFAVRSDARAIVWRSDLALARDSAARYPEGLPAQRMRAQEAAARSDVEGTVAALRAARIRGFDRFDVLEREPRFQAMREDPRFRAVVAEVAGAWIEAASRRGRYTPAQVLLFGKAHKARGEWDLALAWLARAGQAPGEIGQRAQAEAADTRALREREAGPRAVGNRW